MKYSAEEKIVEDSESDEENHKRTVAERRQKIEKRLSLERAIPASEQKKEIVQELTEIKRKSLIEDKKAIHEEEIMLQMPTDNIIKSSTVPDQIIKLKTTKVETPDVSKTDFDKELQDKFKKTVKVQDNREEIHHDEKSKITYDSTTTEKIIQQQITLEESKPKEIIDTMKKEVKIETKELKTEEKIIKEPISPSQVKAGVSFKTSEPILSKEPLTKVSSIPKQITHLDKHEVIEAVSETVTDILDKSQQIVSDVITKKEDIKHTSKIPIKKMKTESKEIIDPDLEKKLIMRKEKIEKSISNDDDQITKTTTKETITSAQKSVDKIKVEFKDETSTIDDIVPKSYHEKQRASFTEEEFYKSVEASITKKMSEGLIQIDDNILSSGMLNFLSIY